MEIKMKIKNLILKNWDIHKDVRNFVPKADMGIKWQQSENMECFVSLTARRKSILEQHASQLPILSDRCRTLKNIPKSRKINTFREYIY